MTVQAWELEGGHFFFLSSLCETVHVIWNVT